MKTKEIGHDILMKMNNYVDKKINLNSYNRRLDVKMEILDLLTLKVETEFLCNDNAESMHMRRFIGI